jgi:Uma2 family endonuclease
MIISLGRQLINSPCKVYPSDLKVRVPNSTTFFYPDICVVCGETLFADDQRDIILNPILIVEVLSESTAASDRGKKFLSYQQIETLEEYVLVSQDEFLIECYKRQNADAWLYFKMVGLDHPSLILPGIGCELDLKQIYNKVI